MRTLRAARRPALLVCLSLALFLAPAAHSSSPEASCRVPPRLLAMLRAELESLRQDYEALLQIISELETASTDLQLELTDLRSLSEQASRQRLQRIAELEALVSALQEASAQQQNELQQALTASTESARLSTKLRLQVEAANAALASSTPWWTNVLAAVGGAGLCELRHALTS